MLGLVQTPGDFGNEGGAEGKPLVKGLERGCSINPECPRPPRDLATLCSESIKQGAGNR